jgi:hypothetical protein
MSSNLHIQVSGRVPPGLADQLADDLGVYPHLESGRGRSPGAAAAEILVSGALGAFFGSMVQQLGVHAADNLARALGRLVRSASRDHADPPVELMLADEATGIRYVLTGDVVANTAAMQALLDLDDSAFRHGTTLHWDADHALWSEG